MRKNTSSITKKIILYSMTLGFIASFILSFSFPLISYPVRAVDSSSNPDDWTPQVRAARAALFYGFHLCKKDIELQDGGLHDRIEDGHAKEGNWFRDSTLGDNKTKTSGYVGISPNDNGQAQCDDIVKALVEQSGTTPIEFLCLQGAQREDKSDCVNSNSSGDNARFTNSFKGNATVAPEVWGDAVPSYSGASLAVLYFEAFTDSNGCRAERIDTDRGDQYTYKIKTVNNTTGQIEENYYYAGEKPDHKIHVYVQADQDDIEMDCSGIAEKINTYAPDYAAWIKAHPDTPIEDPGDRSDNNPSGDSTTTCNVEGVGWMVCPVLTFVGKINDAAFGLLSDMLIVKPDLLADADTKAAWGQFRNLANVAFVAVFLVIIYSQITGAGLSNYGLKRLLPKLVIAAVLVNVSYFICQIAVDISNIVGSSIYGFFKDIPTSAGGSAAESSFNWVGVIAAVLVGAIILLLLASVLGGAALLAFGLVILILVARKAILILLIVISPLAFVAYLLPNTEKWFKKWWSLFSSLLMVFPVVGVIFGASFLAARIVGNGGDTLLQLTALGIMAVPLFAVPVALKGAMAATGAVGAKLNGWQDRAMGAAGSKGKERYGNSSFARGRAGRKQLRQHYRDRKFAEAVSGKDSSKLGKVRGVLGRGMYSVTPGGKSARSKQQSNALADITAKDNKEYAEAQEVARQSQQGRTTDELLTDIKGGKMTAHEKSAAIERVMSSGSAGERRGLIQDIATNGANYEDHHVTAATQTAFSKGDNGIWGNEFAAKIMKQRADTTGTVAKVDLSAEAVNNAAKGNVTAEQWAASGASSEWLAGEVAASGNTTAKANLKAKATEAATPGSTTQNKLNDAHKRGEALL